MSMQDSLEDGLDRRRAVTSAAGSAWALGDGRAACRLGMSLTDRGDTFGV
jgi:hypothetical protein